TTDSAGDLFFGFRVVGTPPAPGGLPSDQSGFARISVSGVSIWSTAQVLSGDNNITRDVQDSAPVLSNDQTILYVPVKATSTDFYGYLLGLNSTTLQPLYRTATTLRDPRNSNNNAGLLDDSTSSVVVGPDYTNLSPVVPGDVYIGVSANPD